MPFTTRLASTSRQAMIRLASRSEGTKILQDLQAGGGGLFRMELHAENVVVFHRSGESAAVTCAGDGVFNQRRAIRMCVIDELSAVHAAQQPRAAIDLDLVPTDVRRLDRGRE